MYYITIVKRSQGTFWIKNFYIQYFKVHFLIMLSYFQLSNISNVDIDIYS